MAVFVFSSGVASGGTGGSGGGGGVIPSPNKSTFADNTWEEIIQACQESTVPDTWMVGDQKAMTINGAEYLIDIIGKNHDVYSDGTGTAPLTLQLHDLYGTEYSIHTSGDNSVGWTGCAVRTTHLPAILQLMPNEVQTAIRAVNKFTAMPSKADIQSTADKLFLLSEYEIFGKRSYSSIEEGTQYEYYLTTGNSLKYKGDKTDTWWERSPRTNSTFRYCMVTTSGAASIEAATVVHPISFAFCF